MLTQFVTDWWRPALILLLVLGCVAIIAVGMMGDALQAQSPANNGGPRIEPGWATPSRYEPTGCKVLWNDRQKIHDYFVKEEHGKTELGSGVVLVHPDIKFAGLPEGATTTWRTMKWHRTWYQIGYSEVDGDRDAYTAAYDDFVDSFFDWRFFASNGVIAAPASKWLDFGEWRDGIDGFGENWRWQFGRVGDGTHWRFQGPMDLNCYHIAQGSHSHDANGNPVNLFLPLAPAEPPAGYAAPTPTPGLDASSE